jgi:hypothetical protein
MTRKPIGIHYYGLLLVYEATEPFTCCGCLRQWPISTRYPLDFPRYISAAQPYCTLCKPLHHTSVSISPSS